jgi:hypothetical protein
LGGAPIAACFRRHDHAIVQQHGIERPGSALECQSLSFVETLVSEPFVRLDQRGDLRFSDPVRRRGCVAAIDVQ